MTMTLLPVLVTTIGLICDIIGAFLVANEVVRIFKGPAAIDIGDAGSINGGTHIVPNPNFEKHEIRKRRTMKWGLGFLVIGFLLQGIGAWLPSLLPPNANFVAKIASETLMDHHPSIESLTHHSSGPAQKAR